MASSGPLHCASPRHGESYTYTPSNASSYYPSSSSSHPTTATSYYSPSSVTTPSVSHSPRMNPGLAAALYVTKGKSSSKSRLRRQDSDGAADDMIDEGFFSGPGSPERKPKSKPSAKIKPLLKKVSSSTSRANSLDLSRSDGGVPGGVGLGIYEYDSTSGVDDAAIDTAFPRYPVRRHRRNMSSTSGTSPLLNGPNQPFAHPKRQHPRVYHPENSYNGAATPESCTEDAESEDDLGGVATFSRRPLPSRAMSANQVQGLRLNTSYEYSPMLPSSSMHDLHSRAMTPTLASPVSPASSFEEKRPRGRNSTSSVRPRDISPSFAASVQAARLAWEAKEEKKDAKLERKRRRSEDKARASSRASNSRGRGNSGSSEGTVWEDTLHEKQSGDDANEEEGDDEEDEVYVGRGSFAKPRIRPTLSQQGREEQNRGRYGTGKKWGLGGSASEGGRCASSMGKSKKGLKKRWLNFMVWLQIHLVRLQRKMGF